MHSPVITDYPLVSRDFPDQPGTDDPDGIDREVWMAACLVAWPVCLLAGVVAVAIAAMLGVVVITRKVLYARR